MRAKKEMVGADARRVIAVVAHKQAIRKLAMC